MRFLTPLLALIGFLVLSVAAAPTPFSSTVLAIPDPNTATYEADIAAAVAYARSAPLASATSPAANASGKQCGYYSIVAGGFVFPTYTTDMYCNEAEEAEEMHSFWNYFCGFCIVFNGM
jgi:hypothetical protein